MREKVEGERCGQTTKESGEKRQRDEKRHDMKESWTSNEDGAPDSSKANDQGES